MCSPSRRLCTLGPSLQPESTNRTTVSRHASRYTQGTDVRCAVRVVGWAGGGIPHRLRDLLWMVYKTHPRGGTRPVGPSDASHPDAVVLVLDRAAEVCGQARGVLGDAGGPRPAPRRRR